MSELDQDALKTALERGRVTDGSRLVAQLEANPEAIRTLAKLALAQLPAGPAPGEDEAAWATFNEVDALDLELPAAPAVTPAAFAGPEVVAPMAPTMVRPPSRGRGGLWALVAGVALAAGAGGTWWVMRSQPTSAPVAAAPASAAPASVAMAPATEAPAPATEAPASLAMLAPESAAVASAAAPESVAARTPRVGRTPRGEEPAERAAPATAPVSVAAAPATAAARKPAGGGDEVDALLGGLDRKAPAGGPGAAFDPSLDNDPLLPERLSRQQILLVVKQGAGRVAACRAQDPNASGTVTVAMVIEPKGVVSSATIPTGPFKGTPVGACVEENVRTFKFPQFRGEPMRINMPFGL